MIPVVPRIAATGYFAKEPTRTRNSLIKLERPGSASADIPAKIKNDAKQYYIGVKQELLNLKNK
jgi:hypothetical protein